jgi:hypothetical protein
MIDGDQFMSLGRSDRFLRQADLDKPLKQRNGGQLLQMMATCAGDDLLLRQDRSRSTLKERLMVVNLCGKTVGDQYLKQGHLVGKEIGVLTPEIKG